MWRLHAESPATGNHLPHRNAPVVRGGGGTGASGVHGGHSAGSRSYRVLRPLLPRLAVVLHARPCPRAWMWTPVPGRELALRSPSLGRVGPTREFPKGSPDTRSISTPIDRRIPARRSSSCRRERRSASSGNTSIHRPER